jgi:lysyl endopeptidase
MKRLLLPLLFSGLMLNGVVQAQSNLNVPFVSIESPNLDAVKAEDSDRAKKGMFYRIGVNVPANIDFYNQGAWYNDENGNLVGQIHLKISGALALNITFDQYTLPEGAEMRLYNPGTNLLIGPYYSDNNIEEGIMSTAMVKGEEMILEVVIPEDAIGDFKLHIKEIGYFYRNIDPFAGTEARDFLDSESCEVNVACSEGTSYANQKAGVCRILLNDGGWGYCSGSLINNTANDCTPYVLTAEHCGSGATAAEFRTWVYYFKYESATCSNPGVEPISYAITGSVRVASSGTVSAVQKSDFLLVMLKSRPVVAAAAYYNGWNRSATVSGGGVGIHHPAGDIKKISTYSATPTSSTWSGGTANAHWRLTWVGTTNGHGVTEGGSSGSPLFNSAGLIIGDLSGGSSYCTPASAQNSPDLYGKFTYGWNSCGTTPQLKLESWLDRSATGVTTLTGVLNSSCAAGVLPVVDFNASNLYPAVMDQVNLVDVSTNSPFYWQWYITPLTYTFINGTTAYSQYPQVQFTATGNYTVVLYAGNTAGYNYKTKGAYIHVGGVGIEDITTPEVVMYPNPAKEAFYISVTNNTWNFDKMTITMMDMTGKYVLVERATTFNANTISVNIPESISTGFYMVQISDGVNSTTKKLEVVK